MPTEIATYIDELDSNQPSDSTGPVGEGDDHLRLLKAVLQSSFPNISGAMTVTDVELNGFDGRITSAQTDLDALEAAAPSADPGISIAGTYGGGLTIGMDITGLPTITPVLADSIAVYDADGLALGEVDFTALNAILVHDSLAGFVGNEHIDHTAVELTSAANGGVSIDGAASADISASRSVGLDTARMSTLADVSSLDHTADSVVVMDGAATARDVLLQNFGLKVNRVTGAQTPGFANANTMYVHTAAATAAYTIPSNATTAFQIGTVIVIHVEDAAGRVNVSGAGGVTIDSFTGLTSVPAKGTAALIKTNINTWAYVGDAA